MLEKNYINSVEWRHLVLLAWLSRGWSLARGLTPVTCALSSITWIRGGVVSLLCAWCETKSWILHEQFYTWLQICFCSRVKSSECFLSSCALSLSPSAISHSSITLFSTQNDRGACLGDVIVFTCAVTERAVLEWAIDSLFDFGGREKFNVNNQPNDMISSMHYDMLNITLVSAEHENNNKGNLTSELYVLANHIMFGKRVYCRGVARIYS